MSEQEHLKSLLPADWDDWSLDKKARYLNSIRYDWRMWARPNQLPPEGDWDLWLLLAGRGFGKLIHSEWPILRLPATQSGHGKPEWTTFGNIRLGDKVFAPDGTPTMVIGAYDPEEQDEFLVQFSDGSEVSVGPDHEWVTWTHRDRKQASRYGNTVPDEWWSFRGDLLDSRHNVTGHYGPEVRTTESILATLTHGSRNDTNHSIPLTKPLQHDTTTLPVDPYVLGVWLGDGTTADGTITQHPDDAAWLRPHLESLGVPTTDRAAPNTFGTRGLSTNLRSIGVLGNKHVPDTYLFADVEQRLAVVQGLMDTDGSVSQSGHVEFCNTDPLIIDGTLRLLWSLGQKPVARWSAGFQTHPDGTRTRHKDRCRITFTPTVQVFRLPRKADLINTDLNRTQGARNTHRMITNVDKTGRKIQMRCIKVAHESSLFLIGREMIPTHNTRTGAEFIKERMLAEPTCRVGIIGQTIGAARDVCLEGESGLIAVIDPALVLKYNRSLGQLRLKNGSYAQTFSGGDPEKLRGFQSHYLWMDELCAMQYAQATYDMAIMGLRLGRNPKMIVTTTPKPTPLIIDMVNRSRSEPDRVKITTGSTFDNAANLADSTLASLRARYEGTTMGRQELYAELILEEPGALWKRPQIEKNRLAPHIIPCRKEDMAEIVVGVDPNMSQSTERKTECGIIVVGRGVDGHGYVLEDASMERPSPDAWATMVVQMYHKWSANHVVAEVNQGYDLVMHTIHTVDPKVPVKKVYSVRGKSLRAEPIAALAEQDRIHHAGYFQELEDQMVQWVPGNASPDRLDACLAPGTLILMGDGETEVPIEDVSPGDLVLTRDGPREVLFSGMTGVRPLMRLETNYQELFLTEGHPVWVEGIGWVQGHSMQVDATLHTWNTTTKMIGTTRPRLCTTADATRGLSARLGGINVSTTSLPDGRMARRFTDRSFWIGTGSSLTDSLFTTRTTTPTTTIPTTWSPSPTPSTGSSTRSTTTAWPSTWRASGTWQPSGIARMRGGNGTEITGSVRGRVERQISQVTAPNAGSRPSVSATVVGSYAASRVVASVSAVSVVSPVYNLTVAGTHEFIANGILTHNCVHGFTKVLLGGGIAEFFAPGDLPRLPSLIR